MFVYRPSPAKYQTIQEDSGQWTVDTSNDVTAGTNGMTEDQIQEINWKSFQGDTRDGDILGMVDQYFPDLVQARSGDADN